MVQEVDHLIADFHRAAQWPSTAPRGSEFLPAPLAAPMAQGARRNTQRRSGGRRSQLISALRGVLPQLVFLHATSPLRMPMRTTAPIVLFAIG
jgi:hypothetical protein